MSGQHINRVVIVGGGTAGWMTALALARMPRSPAILLIEAPEIGTVGVGEATLPTIRHYNRAVGIDEAEMLRAAQATFKLGVQFCDWRHRGHRFFHGFSDHGPEISGFAPYHQFVRLGLGDRIDEYSIAAVAAREGRFATPALESGSLAASYSYAYHFDASLYAAHVADAAVAAGVRHLKGQVEHIAVHHEIGLIEHVVLRDQRVVDGDLFVDCTGFRALLIGGAMGVGFEDWGHWLPADRAWAVSSAGPAAITPFTRSTATAAGWRWRTPLQHRIGTGQVYASAFQDDEAAHAELLASLEGEALGEPRQLRFRAGHRHRFWKGNCVAIGLSGGFLEPLESTSINLIERGIGRLIELFPTVGFDPVLMRDYDRTMTDAFASIRDFIILHYRLSGRDEPFWQQMRSQPIPETLAHQIELFAATGEIAIVDDQGFGVPSWAAILFGMGMVPRAYHPLADRQPTAAVRAHFDRGRRMIGSLVSAMPEHRAFIDNVMAQAAR